MSEVNSPLHEALSAESLSSQSPESAGSVAITNPTEADVANAYIPDAPVAENYHPYFGALAKTLPIERLSQVSTETRGWAAAMGFQSGLGTSIIEHIADIGPAYKSMSPEAQAQWTADQRSIALRHFGFDEKAVEALYAKAQQVLLDSKNEFGMVLASAPQLRDFWLMQTLANHADALAAKKAAKR